MNFALYKKINNADTIAAFKREAFKVLEVEEGEDMDNIFAQAWEFGHQGGFEEVFWHLNDLVDIYYGDV